MDKVLFVDDEGMLLEIYKGFLQDKNYEVFTATSGKEALKILEKKQINVMFFDLKMPGMTGLELCKKIRSFNPIALIYAVTGFTTLFELSDIRDVGFDDYFKKPVDQHFLLSVIEDSFEKLQRWNDTISK